MGLNRRWEETTNYATWQNGAGEPVEVPSSGEGCTVEDEVCEKCREIYQIRGVMGGLRQIMFGKVCPKCEPVADVRDAISEDTSLEPDPCRELWP